MKHLTRLLLASLAVAACSEGMTPFDNDGGVTRDTGNGGGGDGSAGMDSGVSDMDAAVGDGGGSMGDGSSTTDGGGSMGDGSTGDSGPARCTITPSPQAFMNPSLTLHWRANRMGDPFPNVDQVCSTPAVANIVIEPPDSAQVPEIAFMTFDCAASYRNAVLRVISGTAPHRLLWSQRGTAMPNDTTGNSILRWDGHVAIGELDGNIANGLEIVAVRSDVANFGLIAFHGDGRRYWVSTGMSNIGGSNPSINIADLNGDGTPEVIAGASTFNGRTGALLWQGTNATGENGQGPLSVVANLDDDDTLEVIAGGTVYESTGRIRFMSNGQGFSAVGDLLDAMNRSGRDGVAEVVRVVAGRVEILDRRTGMVRWTQMIPTTTLGGAPTIADFDGDGESEIGVAGALRYVVIDPGCTAAGMGCEARGIRWSIVTEDSSSEVTSSTVFDFNGDGASEVVYNDEEQFYVLDGRTGRVLFRNWNPSQTRTEQAVVADVDGNGQADIVFGANQCAAFAGDKIPAAMQATERVPGLEIWSGGMSIWSGARAVWNEHGYHIDNLTDDGLVPRRESAHWRTHNSFRLNRPRDRVQLAPDLRAMNAPSDCGSMTARVCVTVQNSGDANASTISVGVYDRMGGMRLGMASTMGALAPGRSEVVCVSIPSPGMTRSYYVRVDDTNANAECVEDNNGTNVMLMCGPG
jgi:hypothetical protein